MAFKMCAHHLIFILLSAASLCIAHDAFATCSFECEGTVVDAGCNAITLSTPSHVPIWTDIDQQPLLLASCTVQCCAPGMCSDPENEPILPEDLKLLAPDGTDLMGEFQEDSSFANQCGHPQAFEVQTALTPGITYDVVHSGQIISRFFYDPVPDMNPVDMGPDMSADMGPSLDEDMAPDMAPVTEDMDFVEPDSGSDQGYNEPDDGNWESYDAGHQACCEDYLDMGYWSKTDQDEESTQGFACSSAELTSSTPDSAPLMLLFLSIVGLLYRRRTS